MQHLPTRAEEEILRAVNTYRYMTAEDVAHLLYSPGSLTYVRVALKRLSGEDFTPDRLLYRFKSLDSKEGTPTRVYTLGTAGREYGEKVLGLAIDWHFRPDRARFTGFHHLQHNLALTRVLVAAARWGKVQAAYRLTDLRTGYELARERQLQALPAIPDAWLVFERTADGKRFPILLEIDNGTEFQVRFKEHVRARLTFIRDGEYTKVFQTPAVKVMYLVVGSAERQRAIIRWTEEVLSDLKLPKWGRLFKFGWIDPQDIYSLSLFTAHMWHEPYAKGLVSLFE